MSRIISLQCPICNRAFHGSPTRKYCSEQCRLAAIKTGAYVPCVHCGVSVWRKPREIKRGAKFCSTQCHYAYGRVSKICVQCSAEFSSVRSDAVYRRFCSKHCEIVWRQTGAVLQTACTQCSVVFTITASLFHRPGNRYCSKLCYRAAQAAKRNESLSHLCSDHGYPVHKDGRCRSCVARDWGWKQKVIVFDHYGRECACCGESMLELLTLDHVNNDGAEQRREWRKEKNTAGGGRNFYRWVIKMGFPADLQVLCMNCNAAKHWYGVCPHIRRPAYTQKYI